MCTNKRGAKESTLGKPTLQVSGFPHAENVHFVASERGRRGLLHSVLTGHLYSKSNGHPGTSVLLYGPVISIMTFDCHLSAYFHLLFLATIRPVIGEQF